MRNLSAGHGVSWERLICRPRPRTASRPWYDDGDPKESAMDTDTITFTISVPPEVAKAYRDASPEMKRKWDLIARFQLEAIVTRPPRSWEEIATDLSAQAARNGLTEEELQDILREWDEERKAARAASAADK
jgi:hypothetical protein